MQCPKCDKNWIYWYNLGKINAYLHCPDCGYEGKATAEEKEEYKKEGNR